MSLGARFDGSGYWRRQLRRTATYVDKILKGATDQVIEQPKGRLAVAVSNSYVART